MSEHIGDPTTRLIVETLIKTGVSKGLELAIGGVSKLLGKALKDGDQAKAAEIIEKEGIAQPVADIAFRALRSTYVISVPDPQRATPSDLLNLYVEIVKFGIRLAQRTNATICLPGSIVGSHTVSFFSGDGVGPKITRDDMAFHISFEPRAGMAILPKKDPLAFTSEFWGDLRRKRETTLKFINAFSFYEQGCLVSILKTRSVDFDNAPALSPEASKALGAEASSSKLRASIPIRDWDKGIEMLLDFARALPDVDVLPEADRRRAFDIAMKLSDHYEPEAA